MEQLDEIVNKNYPNEPAIMLDMPPNNMHSSNNLHLKKVYDFLSEHKDSYFSEGSALAIESVPFRGKNSHNIIFILNLPKFDDIKYSAESKNECLFFGFNSNLMVLPYPDAGKEAQGRMISDGKMMRTELENYQNKMKLFGGAYVKAIMGKYLHFSIK